MSKIIEVRVLSEECTPFQHKNGNWIDLRASEDIELNGPKLNVHTNEIEFQTGKISLGIAMKLPEGYEAHVVPRSSTFDNYGILLTNSKGIIDESYSGTNDIWKFSFIAYKNAKINKGDRICQFRIVKTMENEFGGVDFLQKDTLDSNDRGGYGTTGVK